MDEDGRVDGSAVREESDQALVVQIPGPHVVSDVYADVARGHCALDLAARQVDVLQRHLAVIQTEKS